LSVRRIRVVSISVLAVLAGLVAAVPHASADSDPYPEVPTPTVTGPIAVTPSSYPFLATDKNLNRYGYVEQEFFFEGRGYRYDTSGGIGQDATRNGNTTYPFKSRMVVRRPVDPAKANGVVVAEWNNVTAGRDIEWNWFGDPEFLLKNGYTFVGVTAQQVGVNGLKLFDRSRYGDLEVRWAPLNPPGTTTDDLSYDIYASALKAVKGAVESGPKPLGDIDVKTIIASGESQSCGRLATHHNSIQPLHEIVDAYLLTVCGSALRTDRPEKVVRVLSETENRTQRTVENFPDTESIRHWEVAGSSHLPRMAWDNSASLINRDYLPLEVSCSKFPLSLVQWPFTVNRAISGLADWLDGKPALPEAPRGQYVSNPDYVPGQPSTPTAPNPEFILDRDQYGIAKGGIRYPDLTVPTAVNDGVNGPKGSGPFDSFCGLLGSSTSLAGNTLNSLYPDHADYVRKYSRAADQLLKSGFVLAEDVARLKKSARQFPRLRPAAPRLARLTAKGKRPRLTWVGTEAPGATFQVQRARVKGKKKLRWSNAKSNVRGRTVTLPRQPKGVWRYRVRGSSVIPKNNIALAEEVVTPFSKPGNKVRIKR